MAARRRRRPTTATAEQMEWCRLYRHAWYPDDVVRVQGGWKVSIVCERCGTKRGDVIDANGFLHSRSYEYVEGYRDASHRFDSIADRRATFYASDMRDELERKRTKRAG